MLPDEKKFKINMAPELDGSEKQVKWANDIRKSLVVELGNYAAYYTDDGKLDTNNMFKTAIAGKESMINAVKKAYKIRKMEPNASISKKQASEYNERLISSAARSYEKLSERIQRFNKITGEKSAKWWIENRYNTLKLKEYIDGKRKSL